MQASVSGYRDNFPTTPPVADLAPNRFGLQGMGGNAWEWCDDWFDRDKARVLRGGAWNSNRPDWLLSSRRDKGPPAVRGTYFGSGFRCMLETRSPTPL